MEKKYSKLHGPLQLKEYLKPFENLNEVIINNKEKFEEYVVDKEFYTKILDNIKNKEEFLKYIELFQIDKNYLLEQILQCRYLEYLDEYMKDDIIQLLKNGCSSLNDENLEYISKYIEIKEFCAYNKY